MPTSNTYTFKNLFFEATRLCNYACPMCMASSNDVKLVKKSRKQELSLKEIEQHIFKTVDKIGVEKITWSGGEFILRKDAVELVKLATSYGYSSVITTNGSKMTREKLLELKEASNDSVVIAVGINSIEDENSWTRDTDCEQSLAVLELCNELDIRQNVVVAIGQHNLKTIERTLQWLDDHHIPYNRSPYTARGYGREYWDELKFSKKNMQDTIHPALRKHANGYISYTPFFLSPELHDDISSGISNITVPQNPSIGCWCGTWLAVNAEGDVSPCGILLDDVNCGNVREKTFQQIIDDSGVFQKILDRTHLKGKCGRCRYQFTCGGCRAMAFYESGDIMAEDPTCFFEPIDKTTVSEHEPETNKMFKKFVAISRFADKINEMKVTDKKSEH
ncbi:hypothetical protein MNBD_GAMMA23-561 [hydrothermal vent metagenome]|uniref:Radical SAM core domain-containing protein n=1 Tax=hydrothermal vent metagenome TaxID=652676 RepID=A0A3B1ATQ8_9ZZZZ